MLCFPVCFRVGIVLNKTIMIVLFLFKNLGKVKEHLRLDLTQGGARDFPTGGLTLPTRGLKYGFQGIVNAKNLRQNSCPPSDRGLACSDRRL